MLILKQMISSLIFFLYSYTGHFFPHNFLRVCLLYQEFHVRKNHHTWLKVYKHIPCWFCQLSPTLSPKQNTIYIYCGIRHPPTMENFSTSSKGKCQKHPEGGCIFYFWGGGVSLNFTRIWGGSAVFFEKMPKWGGVSRLCIKYGLII